MDIPFSRGVTAPRHETWLVQTLANRPLKFGMFYLVASALLFQFGPIAYPTQNRIWVLLYIAATFLCVAAGYVRGLASPPTESSFRQTRIILLIGAITSVTVLFPSAWAYTGRMPWEVLSALSDQKSSYFGLQDQLAATEGTRNGVILLRMLTQPFSYAALPLGIIYWRRSNIAKVAAVAAATSSLTFSILRGTDREVADLIIISLSAFLVVRARTQLAGFKPKALPFKQIFAGLAVLVVLLGAYNIFSQRKTERMGTISAFCIGEMSGACADYNNPLLRVLPDQQKFSVAMVAGYFTNGYYGMGLALARPWEPTWGLGHSSGLQRVYQEATGDSSVAYRTYEYRNGDDGWPGKYVWSGAMTALANDVSFWGALVLIAGFGLLWARSWVNATFGMSDPAAVVFALSMHTLLYLPANLQLLQTLDGYTTVVAWIAIWVLTSRRPAR